MAGGERRAIFIHTSVVVGSLFFECLVFFLMLLTFQQTLHCLAGIDPKVVNSVRAEPTRLIEPVQSFRLGCTVLESPASFFVPTITIYL